MSNLVFFHEVSIAPVELYLRNRAGSSSSPVKVRADGRTVAKVRTRFYAVEPVCHTLHRHSSLRIRAVHFDALNKATHLQFRPRSFVRLTCDKRDYKVTLLNSRRWMDASDGVGLQQRAMGSLRQFQGRLESIVYVRDEQCIIRTGVLTCEVIPSAIRSGSVIPSHSLLWLAVYSVPKAIC